MNRPIAVVGTVLLLTAAVFSGCALGQATQATDVQATQATLNGKVSAIEAGPVEHWFQYGTTTAYGSETVHRSLTVSDHDDHPVAEPVQDLAPGTGYHFRLCARNAGQSRPNCGGDKTFTTPDDGARHHADRPDDFSAGTQQVHVLYVLPADGADRELDTNGVIAATVGVATDWMSDQTGGQPFRLDTAGGALDVTFVRLAATDAELAANGVFLRDAIEAELEERGFDDPRKVYSVYYDGTAHERCGGATWPPTLLGHVVALYLGGQFEDPETPDCETNPLAEITDPPGYWEFAFLHELMHGMGAVPTCAPNHVLDGHTGDQPNDLMYAGPESWEPSALDPGNDDYYGHGRSDCLDVAESGYLVGNDPAPLPGEDL